MLSIEETETRATAILALFGWLGLSQRRHGEAASPKACEGAVVESSVSSVKSNQDPCARKLKRSKDSAVDLASRIDPHG